MKTVSRERIVVRRCKEYDRETRQIRYLNTHIDDNDPIVIEWLTWYITTSYRRFLQDDNGVWKGVQPAFPNNTVIAYKYVIDNNRTHKKARFELTLDDGTAISIGGKKFKRFLRRRYYLGI